MILRRRNSIATSLVVPFHLTLPTNPHPLSSSFPPAATTATTSSSSSDTDVDSLPVKPISSYTSLKYLISGGGCGVHSPTAATPPGSEISIRNRLVQQAAWAYLRPMSTSSDSSADRTPLFSLFCSAVRAVARAFDWAFRPFQLCFQ